MSILIACIGNIFQGDDAFGCEVAAELSRRSLPGEVRVVDFGIRGIDLTYALLNAPELTIFVDVVPRGDPPGTLYTIKPDLENPSDDAGTGVLTGVDAHSMDPLQVLRAVKSMGGSLGRILLVGCQAGDLGGEEGRMGLTPPVQEAVGRAADMVESLVAEELQGVQI